MVEMVDRDGWPGRLCVAEAAESSPFSPGALSDASDVFGGSSSDRIVPGLVCPPAAGCDR